jgi:hypothetical protein
MTTIDDISGSIAAGDPEPAGSWAQLSGRWKINNGEVLYIGPDAHSAASLPAGLCLNSKRLTDGEITVNARLKSVEDSTAGIFVGYSSPNRPYILVQLGAYRRAYAISQFEPSFGFISLINAGTNENLEPNRDYRLRIQFAAQRIRFSVDDVEVLDHVLGEPLKGAGWGLSNRFP